MQEHGFMHEINAVDYGIIGLIGMSVFMGILRGFVREAISLITWVAALVIGVLYCETASHWLTMISMAGLRMILAFVLLVLITLILGGLLGYFIGRLIKFTGFGVTDRMIGTIFGLARGVAVVSAAVLIASPTPFSKDPLWTGSRLIPRFEPVALWMRDRIPEDILKKVQL
jgi:membrane protein required for colicin V production